ncbi:hypothetical protein TNCV_2750311 [Trichonephila clavipes]|nr:hypothetical protein TNCV_2750311 [Trichonephila clavipes]
MEGKPSDGREYSTGMNVARFSCTRALDHVMWNHSTEGFHSSPVFSQGGYVSLKGRRSNGKGKTQRGQAGNRGNSQGPTGNKQTLNGGCQACKGISKYQMGKGDPNRPSMQGGQAKYQIGKGDPNRQSME